MCSLILATCRSWSASYNFLLSTVKMGSVQNSTIFFRQVIPRNFTRTIKGYGQGNLLNWTEYNRGEPQPAHTVGQADQKDGQGGYYQRFRSVPVLARTVRTGLGSCFALSTKEFATLEQRYQGRLQHLGIQFINDFTFQRMDYQMYQSTQWWAWLWIWST